MWGGDDSSQQLEYIELKNVLIKICSSAWLNVTLKCIYFYDFWFIVFWKKNSTNKKSNYLSCCHVALPNYIFSHILHKAKSCPSINWKH